MNPVAPRTGLFSALQWCPPWVALLIIAVALPSDLSFSLGSLRLTPYRLVLVVLFVPALFRLWSGRAGRVLLVDWLLTFHVLWAYVALGYHHGASVAVESGGIRMLELYGSYLIARTTIVDERTFRGAAVMLFTVVSVLAPFVLVESVTGIHLIKAISAKLSGHSFHSPIQPRFGLSRAYGPFDHPILLGIFVASTLGLAARLALPQLGYPRGRFMPRGAAVTGALSSLSSGALATLTVQMGLLLWDRKTAGVSGRWAKLTAIFAVVYVVVDAISNRSGFHVFLHYLTFSATTAYNRIIIFEWGIQDVWRNPWLGIGFNVWTRPPWMHSTSMDNFWLVQAVSFGIPGFLSVALAAFLMLKLAWGRLPVRLSRLRLGWAISLIGMIVAATTVHFWNNLFVYFFFFLGMGAWFLNVQRTPARVTEEPAYE